MAVTHLAERAAMVQRDLNQTVVQMRPTKAKTLATFEQGTRKKTAQLAGIQMAYWQQRANGQTWYNPLSADFSFKRSTKQTSGAMYAGVVFRNMNFTMEEHIQKDMERGFIPDSYLQERARRIGTHMWKKNKAAIHDGTGGLAKVASDASGSTVTLLADNSARGTSKGNHFLQVSTADDTLLYDAVDATDTVVATFWISAKPTSTTVTTGGFTVGAITDVDTGDWICESGSWKKEMWGIGYHISDSTSRIYQGADVAVDTFLQIDSVDNGNQVPTPTSIHAAKSILLTKCNNETFGEIPFVGHITPANYMLLAAFGYPLRVYNAEGGKADTTYGVPDSYEDGNTVWQLDADYEDCYIDLREKAPFFEYTQKEFGLKKVGGQSRHEWIGANDYGSVIEYENYNEACNIVWDSKGVSGTGKEGGNPNTSVFIKNIAMPTYAQYAYGE